MTKIKEHLLLILDIDMYNSSIFYLTNNIAEAFDASMSILLVCHEKEKDEKKHELEFIHEYLTIITEHLKFEHIWVSNFKDQGHFEMILKEKNQEFNFIDASGASRKLLKAVSIVCRCLLISKSISKAMPYTSSW